MNAIDDIINGFRIEFIWKAQMSSIPISSLEDAGTRHELDKYLLLPVTGGPALVFWKDKDRKCRCIDRIVLFELKGPGSG